jgi:hypothetical protein
MKQARELAEAIKMLTDKGDKIFPAVVKSVDKNNDVCDVEFDELEIGEVRLRATVNENAKGFKIYPTENSNVLVEKINDEEYFIVMVSDIDEVVVNIDNTLLKVNAEGISISKGEDSLLDVLTLIIDAVSEIMVLYGKNPNYLKLTEAKMKLNNILK